MAEEGVSEQGGLRIPPYISFQTFLTFMKDLKTNGLPPQIDKSVMSKLAGGMQGQLKMGLRSLGLISGDVPTPRFAALIEALETPQFEGLLLNILKDTYPYVFALDLMTATPTMFADAFKVTGAKEDVSRKCRTFFLHAAKRAGVPLGTRLLTGSVPRSTNGTSKRRKAKPKEEAGGVVHTPNNTDTISDKAMEYKLVDLMKEDDVGDDERTAIWTLIQYLTRKTKAAAQ